ncbi:LLM class flavin-dependent oxidoreductase [Pseudofrankia saprophytica]|uniref:LLM class flavin-dependent oxidoreductase n=1 Tax=Pseudofrankia saprophytica TaxID=298655 RepID=UPI000234D005|nr:LLM class flavin-dependent oxidoreductase [Pseudofrankia saprophytica]
MADPATTAPLHLAVALDGAGWHPAAWREPDARPAELFTPGYWLDQVLEAERGLLDLVTIEDSLGLQSSGFDGPDDRTDQVRGRLDAVLIAARVSPLTSHIGLVPTATVSHTEPFHISKAIATLDFTSQGRAGWRAQTSRPAENSHFGRRTVRPFRLADYQSPEVQAVVAESFDEAADFVEVVRRLWDSWEDDAEIRDVASGRFVDRDKLHYIDFEGRWFKVRGPSIVPRPPQGQPVVSALAHATIPYRLGARAADIVYVTPRDEPGAAAIVAEIRAEQEAAGRAGETIHVFGDLVVFLDETAAAAAARKDRLDETAGEEYASDALVFTGTAAELADLLLGWQRAGLSGYRLRPGAVPHDLEAITRALVPELQRRGAFRTAYEADTLRGLLGLGRPANRYAIAAH